MSDTDTPQGIGSMKGYEMEAAMTEVTQADREAAVSLIRTAQLTGLTEYLTEIEDGCYDENFFVQAFARHRTTAEAAKDARIKELEAKLSASERERATLFLNKRVNDAFQTALERGELTVGAEGWVAAHKEIENG